MQNNAKENMKYTETSSLTLHLKVLRTERTSDRPDTGELSCFPEDTAVETTPPVISKQQEDGHKTYRR